MKRTLASLVGLALVASVFAQGAFTIRRPTNGSLVRETIKVRIPRASISEGSYVGIWVNGKFLEAVVPSFGDKVEDGLWIYELDSKERELADGNLKIEAVLYAPFGDGTRVVNRSSVNVRLDNRSSLKAPAGGFQLRYNFVPGQEMIYSVKMRVGRSVISEAQAKLGGRAAELGAEVMAFRYLIGFDQRLENGSRGLVRMQAHPNNGKDYVTVQTSGDDAPKKYYKDTINPIYMMISNTGREIFGRAPFYTGIDGNSGGLSNTNLYATFPLPVLPQKGVTVGSTWSASFIKNNGTTPEKIAETPNVTTLTPARGTVEAIEYQNGERTVKVRNKIAVSGAGGGGVEDEEIYWFSLDRGVVLKIERNFTQTTRIRVTPSGGGGGAAGGGGTPAGPGGKRGLGAGPGGGGGGNAGASMDNRSGPGGSPTVPTGAFQGKGGGGGRTAGPGAGGGGGNGRGGSGSGSGGAYRVVRERIQTIMTLDAITR
ncbi:MAG: hypothetical protein JNJ45_01615 [Chthonomonas sp.]|nr:hypothetical protein [Chthonomonas sp.]